jgi:hypothetical protein
MGKPAVRPFINLKEFKMKTLVNLDVLEVSSTGIIKIDEGIFDVSEIEMLDEIYGGATNNCANWKCGTNNTNCGGGTGG